MQSVNRYTDHFIPSWYWVLGDNFWNPLIPEDQYITYKKHLFLVAYWWFHVVWKPVWSTTIYSTSVKSFSQCRPSIFHLIFTLTFLLITIILKQEGDIEITESRSLLFRDTKVFNDQPQTTIWLRTEQMELFRLVSWFSFKVFDHAIQLFPVLKCKFKGHVIQRDILR